ncbi:MAG: branched-chain amino acid ABC transporter permease [Methylobacteriaceae bacterium]|nr:branched-chain amino acid ABC transporter permease [Methylobacteriaceae bacterium]
MPDAPQRSFAALAGVAALMAALIALPFLAKWAGQPALIPLASRILIYAIAAASLNLALGYGGMVSFGHAAFFGLGGYVVGVLYQAYVGDARVFGLFPGTNQLLVTLPLAMLVSGALALAIGALSLRTAGVQFIMITLAFAQMLFYLFVSLKAYGGDDGLIVRRRNVLFDLDARDDATFYFFCLAAATLVFVALWRIVVSRFGLILGGLRQNETRMEAIGVAPYRYKLAAFVLSGMGAGLAGALMANLLRFVSPDMLHWTKSGELMIMVILGGVGTLFGPLLGAAAFIALETFLTAWTEHWQLALGPILLVVVLFTRGGLHALLARLSGRRS